jgi:hypothetical protein
MIHYHGTPFSGREPTMVKSLQGKHAMVSFADPSNLPLVAELCQSFTLDNGAFSAWSAGKPFDIEGFAQWVKEWHRHPGFDWYVIPDVIDGDDQDNSAMRSKWRQMLCDTDIYSLGVPVWHLHEKLETLDYLSRAYKRVALGSSGEYATVGNVEWFQRMSEAMDTVCDDGFPRCKLHGFRMLDPTIFSHFPLSSADSTNVARNIGICQAWRGTYTPASKHTRALIMMERIEQHASAARWCNTQGVKRNMELFG